MCRPLPRRRYGLLKLLCFSFSGLHADCLVGSNRKLLLQLFLSLVALEGYADGEFPSDRLQVVAVIDGSDVLHLSKAGATWTHKTWSWATGVRINGQSWNVQQNAAFVPSPAGDLVREDLSFSGAVLHVLRGRGSVRCQPDGDGLAIEFEDGDLGSDTYEIAIDFAPALVHKDASRNGANPLRLRILAQIDGTDEAWLSSPGLEWVHTSWDLPQKVTVNSTSWDLSKKKKFPLSADLSPESLNFQRATVQKYRGRGRINLDYCPERQALESEYFDATAGRELRASCERLCVEFEDPPDGSDWYEAEVVIPEYKKRHLVRLTAAGVSGISGTPVRIFHVPAASEMLSVVPGERFFSRNGECLVALEPGKYQFEALRQAPEGHLIALRTQSINVDGPTNVDLHPQDEQPVLLGQDDDKGAGIELDELAIRSSRPGGAIRWKRATPGQTDPVLTLSRGETYRVHAFGHSGTNYFAVWTALLATNPAKLAVPKGEWLDRSFAWLEGTPASTSRGVILQFPDGTFEIPKAADACRFFTNRRFFTVAYWLGFPGDHRAVFEPRPIVVAAGTHGRITFGGPLTPVASAAVLQDEKLGRPDALRLWFEETLADKEGDLLNTKASTIEWSQRIALKDGTTIPSPPLPTDFAKTLQTDFNQLIANARCVLDKPTEWTVVPQPTVPARFGRFSTVAPPYRAWNSASYLSKAERELMLIDRVRGVRADPTKRIEIKWWFNDGAVGGGNSVTMPMKGYLQCLDWYTHTWAIAHETLHNFGFGHGHEMNRIDAAVQEQMDFFRWYAADNPAYVPPQVFDR
jgi:hypothetical protein